MTLTTPTLHMMCGKIAAGKSTLAARLGRMDTTVLIAEDDWLNALFADRMSSAADYVRCASTLRKIMGPHVSSLLTAGVSVVLDFPANTVESRDWMRDIVQKTSASHQLHVLDVSVELCLERLRARNKQGDHPFAVTVSSFVSFQGILSRHRRMRGSISWYMTRAEVTARSQSGACPFA